MSILLDEHPLQGKMPPRKRPRLSGIREEQDFTKSGMNLDVVNAPDQSIMDDLPSTTGPSFFHDASYISANNGIFSAAGRDQYINITNPGRVKSSIFKLFILMVHGQRHSNFRPR